MSDAFDRCVEWVLSPDIEGVHGNQPGDIGGDTWFGLARNFHPNENPWPPTKDRAIRIYRHEYWEPGHCDELPPWAAACVFDCRVNQNPVLAATSLQRAVGTTVDGIIGPKTIKACFSADRDRAIVDMLAWRMKSYTEQDLWAVDWLGWTRRMFRLQQFCLGL